MALLFMDSFDHYVTADMLEKWTSQQASGEGATPQIGASSGRHSSGSFRVNVASPLNNARGGLIKTLTPSGVTAIIGVAVVPPTTSLVGSQGIQLASIRDGSSPQMSLRLNNDLTLSAVRGAHNGTVLGTSTATLTASAFVYIEWKVLIDPSAGTVDVRVNGTSVLALTAQNTRNTGATQWTGVGLGVLDSAFNTWNGGFFNIDYDDLYVLDGSGSAPCNAFLGDCRVDARFPTGAGSNTGWTPSTGANWQNVDDAAPNDDTDYNAAASTGLTDTFVVQDAAVPGATIFGVQHCLSMKKSDAGTCTVAPVVRHISTDLAAADLSPGTSYAYGLLVQQTYPGTGSQWTEAQFNAAEFGYRRTA